MRTNQQRSKLLRLQPAPGCRRFLPAGAMRRRIPAALLALACVCGASWVTAQPERPVPRLFTIDAVRPPVVPETGYLEMGSDSAGRSPDGSTLTVDSRSLVLNGAPWLPVMGEFHFSRCPRKYWEEELLKMKAGGVRIVSTYVFWIHHEEIEGRFDWSGQRDLRAFVALCGRLGLYAYPRIGPWAHGEARNGGFPDWLMAKGPTRVGDSTFLSAVRVLYGEIGRQLKGLLWKEGGPVIGIQIENEYSNRAPNGGDGYLMALKRMAMDAGMDVPLYTITGWDNAVIPPRAFVPVYGGYPDEAWSGSTGELPPDPQGVFQFHVGTPVGTAGIMQGPGAAAVQAILAHFPKFTAELGGGMEDTYHRRVVIAPDEVAAMAVSALGSGVNLLGYYMFHGGTNPEGRRTTLEESQATGYPNDLPVKSYDFQAPLGEAGQMTAAFRALKSVHLFLHDFGGDLAAMTAVAPDIVPSGPRDTTTLRVAARIRGDNGFLFFNNYLRHHPIPEQKGVQVRLNLPSGALAVPDRPCTVPSQSFFIWPVNLDLQGARLRYATAQPVARVSGAGGEYYFFTAVPFPRADFVFDASTVRAIRAGSGRPATGEGEKAVRGVVPSRSDAMVVTTGTGKEVHIVLLSSRDTRNLWKARLYGRDQVLISAADLFWNGDTIHCRSREPGSMAISVFPDFRDGARLPTALRARRGDGIFTRYAVPVAPVHCDVRITGVRAPGVVPPVATGPYYDWRKCAVAQAPDDSMFGRAGLWRLTVSRTLPPGVCDLYLRIAYTGDIARLSEGDRLLEDDYFNGKPWEIGLSRIDRDTDGTTLDLRILPLRRDAPVYLQEDMRPQFNDAVQAAAIRSVALTPEYEVKLPVGKRDAARAGGVILGGDISFVAAPGRGRYARLPAYQDRGTPGDEAGILMKHGWKAFRLRVFVSPVREAPDNSLARTIPLARRIKSSGGLLCIDLHFSDTWADPQHQEIPVAWRGLALGALERRVERHAADVIRALKNAGAMPDWVQIGNEITRGTLWPVAQVQIPGSHRYNPPEPYDENVQWDHLTRILKAGIRGVKSASGASRPLILIHIDQGGNWPVTRWFFDHLESAGVDFDMIAESFYPEWHHGTLEGLRSTMIRCAHRYGRDFLVAETGYDSSRVGHNEDMLWPVTPAGRLQFMADLIGTVRDAPGGAGVLYWAPERGVWNEDGTPGPSVFVLDSLASLVGGPQSHVPWASRP